jgi:hypothetical protein
VTYAGHQPSGGRSFRKQRTVNPPIVPARYNFLYSPQANERRAVAAVLQLPVDRGWLFRAAQLTLITSASFLHTEPYGCNAGGLLAVLIWVG